MCGRFTLTASIDVVQDLFEIQSLPSLEPHYNIAPTQDVLAVRETPHGREGALLRWGLIPSWAEDRSIASKMINARSETVAQKPAFREAFQHRRCLVVADGFIEWERRGSVKQPYWLQLDDGSPLGFAGLWERWRDEAGAWLETCTILTTTPNTLVSPIHNRMPVIVPRSDYGVWLDPAASPGDLGVLLTALPANQMRSTAISTRINNVRNDDPDCLARVEIQGALL